MDWKASFRQRLASTGASILAGAILWVASLSLYLFTLAPTLTWGVNEIGVDGGELLAAADSLGVPHPPGYPTYTLLLKLFATVVPIGDFAHRGNLMSAVLASIAVVLVYAIALRLCRALTPDAPNAFWTVGAALGATVFASSPLLWSQATITEVYTLNALFVGALLLIASYLALRPSSERGHEAANIAVKLALFGFLLGLGLGNHLTLLAVAVPALYWLWTSLGWRRLVSPRAVAALILGLGIYIYLPIRAAQDPPINWGDAATLDGFVWMLTGRAYQDYLFGARPVSVLARLGPFIELIFSQFNPLGIFIGLVGARQLFSGQRGFFIASLASIVILSAYSLTYNTVDSEVLLIPAFMLFSIWIGVGFMAILSSVVGWTQAIGEGALRLWRIRLGAAHVILLLGVIAFGALPAASVILNYRAQDLSRDSSARDYAAEVIDSVPIGSLVLSSEEGHVFALWYIRFVEDVHRDVAPIAVPLLQFDWYWRSIQQTFPERFPGDPPSGYAEALRRIMEHNIGERKVFFTYPEQSLENEYIFERVGRLYTTEPRAAP